MERSAGSSICEGIGIDRKTSNFGLSTIDGSMQATDTEAVEMAHFLKEHEVIAKPNLNGDPNPMYGI